MSRFQTFVRAFVSAMALLASVGLCDAQTLGQIPVFVDTSGTLGDSTIAQDGSGNISLTSGSLTVNNTPGIGVWGESLGTIPGADGVHGVAHGPASGVAGVNDGPLGVGVWGQNTDTGTGGYGVYGVTNLGYGVYGLAISNGGTGVWGVATNGTGVYGAVHGSTGVAVFADAPVAGTYAAWFNGLVAVPTLGDAGSMPLCRNSIHLLAACSSSLRYKTDVRPFNGGLDIVKRLRPIAFTWKQGGMHDVGLGAEDVEQVEPLLTFRNEKGEIEGVKYNQLSAVFVNAFVEQQTQIKKQQEQIDALKALVCESHPDADICR